MDDDGRWYVGHIPGRLFGILFVLLNLSELNLELFPQLVILLLSCSFLLLDALFSLLLDHFFQDGLIWFGTVFRSIWLLFLRPAKHSLYLVEELRFSHSIGLS